MSIRSATFSGLAGLLASGAALAEVPRVAADIPPVHSLVARVMQGLGEPALIVALGASPHGYAMRPSEARDVQEADAVFWIGPELEPRLGESIATLAPETEIVTLLDAPATRVLQFRTGATFAPAEHGDEHGQHDHEDAHAEEAQGQGHDEHAHEEQAYDGGDHDDHAHDGVDPHAWLDPENGKAWLDVIADSLSALDPDNAAAYAANAAAGKDEIDAAAAAAADILAPVSDLRFVVFHDAYQYYETRFNLTALGAIALSDATDPSPARIEEVRDTVRELDVSCVLAEPQFNQALVETVSEGSKVASGVVDPMGSDIGPGPDFYPRLIRSIAEELAACGG